MEATRNIFLPVTGWCLHVADHKMTFKKKNYTLTDTRLIQSEVNGLLNLERLPQNRHKLFSMKMGFKHLKPCKSVGMFSLDKIQHFGFAFTSADAKALTVRPLVPFLHAFYIKSMWTFYQFTFKSSHSWKFLHFYTNKSVCYSAGTAFKRDGVAERSNMNQSGSLI